MRLFRLRRLAVIATVTLLLVVCVCVSALQGVTDISLAQQIAARVRQLHADPTALQCIGKAGQALTRQLYAPERQIGQRQHILRTVASQLGLPITTVGHPAP